MVGGSLVPMKTLIVLAVCGLSISSFADSSFTNLVAVSGSTNPPSLDVGSNQLARIISIKTTGAMCTVPINYPPYGQVPAPTPVFITALIQGQTMTLDFTQMATNAAPVFPSIAGPATVTLTCSRSQCATQDIAFASIEIVNATPPATPAMSVVIPADSRGPVTIMLESSTDLINWNAAMPGTYGTTSSNRFFRVRGTRP